MGNTACCEAHPNYNSELLQSAVVVDKHSNTKIQSQVKPQPVIQEQPKQDEPDIPALYSTVTKTYNQHEFLKEHFENLQNRKVKNYGSDIYQGQINQNNRPHGYGKMYKQIGSLFLGHFDNGKATGNGAYIFPDGSYYQGHFNNNEAHDQNGHYVSEYLTYRGAFQNNAFHGQGQQKGLHHTYKGTYKHGKKLQGKLQWTQHNEKYSYEGSFNDHEQFQGYGILTQPKGVYSGHFVHGLKEGKGQYKSINGLTYKGDYKNDKRNGFGTIINDDDTIAYQGQIKDGMPHGKGSTFNKGVATTTNWVEGIDERIIQ